MLSNTSRLQLRPAEDVYRRTVTLWTLCAILWHSILDASDTRWDTFTLGMSSTLRTTSGLCWPRPGPSRGEPKIVVPAISNQTGDYPPKLRSVSGSDDDRVVRMVQFVHLAMDAS
ncbi:hypothetical protein BD310DRAFT_939689 [Dichomitus squalens]|uniref:Uncharacterized protein n=1 Tax=Dichomitus squalens TaxID=114155 RepID=A0A4Q9PCZ8_9APHY|nr:hypothetical protein BD310DRAFT_939798 [Dichomitus squalens]TBU52710.1 hypothetical protein BD310DRAFT_939689 [Dichomitus squalens]